MRTPGNEQIEYRGNSCIVRFPGPRRVLSTSWLNGGYQKDLDAVFNHQIPLDACTACHSGGSIQEYLEGVARGLLPDDVKAAGLVTCAEMKNTAVVSETFRDLSVSAIVTAGIDKNGARAGDPASYYENGTSFEPVGGTINTILLIGADLPEYAMARAVMTATEAKAAALQQLMARSLYSTGIATGSGTDMIAVISDPASPLSITDAGTHSALGELIAKAVIRATQSALEKETGLSPGSQHDVLVRLERYRVTKQDLWSIAADAAGKDPSDPEEQELFYRHLEQWARRPGSVARIAAALHVIDEESWGLIPRKEACQSVCRIVEDPAGILHGLNCATIPPLRCLTETLAAHIYHRAHRMPASTGRNARRSGT